MVQIGVTNNNASNPIVATAVTAMLNDLPGVKARD